jgi:hypothetical protein
MEPAEGAKSFQASGEAYDLFMGRYSRPLAVVFADVSKIWDAALSIDAAAPDEARTMRFGRAGEIAELLDTAGLTEIAETTLEVHSTYRDFDELWSSLLAGIGPAGSYCVSLSDEQRTALRDELFRRLNSPAGTFSLRAAARCASGKVP